MSMMASSASETPASDGAMPEEASRDAISRRTLLKVGGGTLGLAALGTALGHAVAAATGPGASTGEAAVAANADKFMSASRLLIQHRLSPETGARMAALLRPILPSLDADLDVILRTAHEKNAQTVEDFFDALPEGQVRDTAHRIIFGWYAGVVDEKPDAEVFAYEEALMYQPTKDAIAIPTYSLNVPEHWTKINPALSAMPEF
ncbi:sugar dehydrogenase complex small subunit [Sphingopyxis sp. LARHCG72]